MNKKPCNCKAFVLSLKGRKKSRMCQSEMVPTPEEKKKREVSKAYAHTEVKKPNKWRKKT